MTTVRQDVILADISFLAAGDWPQAKGQLNGNIRQRTIFSAAWAIINGGNNYDGQGIAYDELAEFTIQLCRDLEDDTLTNEIILDHAGNWDLMRAWLNIGAHGLLGPRWADAITDAASPIGRSFTKTYQIEEVSYKQRLYPVFALWITSWAAALVTTSARNVVSIPEETSE